MFGIKIIVKTEQSVLLCSVERVEKDDTTLDGNAVRSEIKDFRTALLTLAVARRKFPLGARIFFDRGAIAVSFPPPRAAIDRKAPPIPPQCP